MIEMGEWFTRENVTDELLRQKVLEDFGRLRSLIESKLLEPNALLRINNELLISLTEAVKAGEVSILEEGERAIREEIGQLIKSTLRA